MKTRASIEYAKTKFKSNKDGLIVAEVGVWKGENAKNMLENLNIKKLYLIDPYIEWFDKTSIIYSQDEITKAEKKAHELLKDYEDKVEWVRQFSSIAKNMIPDCDLVYIDGDHEYDFVLRDMENYYEKLKPGGLLCGDDYRSNKPGVVKAVDEWGKTNDKQITTRRSDWWVAK